MANEGQFSSANAEPMEDNGDLTLSSAATPEETVSSVNGPSNEAQCCSVNTESEISPMEENDNLTLSSAATMEETVCKVKGLSNEAQSSSVNRESEITPMAVEDNGDLTLSSAAAPEETVSNVDGLPNEAQCSSVNMEHMEDNDDLTLSCAATPEETVSNVDGLSNEAHSSSANTEHMEDNDDLTFSCTATPEETVSRIDGLSNEAQFSSVNRESEISPMELGDDPTSCAVGFDKLQVSVVEDPSNEVSSSGINIKTEVTSEADSIVLTFFFAATSEPVSTAVDSSIERRSYSVTRETEIVPMKGFDDLTLSSETATSQTVSAKEDTSSNEGTSSDSVSTTSADTLMEDSDDMKLAAVAKGIHVNNQTSTSVVNRKNKMPLSVSKDFKQPPPKKIKLILAISASNDFQLKTCLENHLKLAISRNWESARDIQHLYHPLVHMVILFGKCDLLEFLLKERLGHVESYVDSTCQSPLQTLLMQIQHYMPTASFDEKVTAFQRMLQLLVQYNYNILLVRDGVTDDSILHTCTKKIRDLSKQIKAAESLEESHAKLLKLLKERKLLEQLFKEMMQAFQKLGHEEPRIRHQVVKLILSRNKAEMTIFKILEAEEFISIRNTIIFVTQQIRAEDEDEVMAENTSTTCTVSKPASACTSVQTALSSLAVKPSQATSLSYNCLSVQAPDGCPNPSTSTTVADSACSSVQTVPPSLVVNPLRATALSPNCLSVQAPDGCPNHSTSTTVAATVQTVVPSLAVNPSRSRLESRLLKDLHVVLMALSPNCPSFQASDGCPTQPTSTTAAASACASVQTVLSSLAVNPLRATAVPRNCPSVQAPDGCPNQSPSTTAAASSLPPSLAVNPSGAKALSHIINCLCVQAPVRSVNKPTCTSTEVSVAMSSPQTKLSTQDVCPHQSTSDSMTVVASACASVQTVLSSLAVNPSRATALSHNCLSVQASDGCPNPSTSTTAVTSACASVQTNPLFVQAPQRGVNKSTTVSVSACSTQTSFKLSSHGVNPSETTELSSDCPSVQSPDQCPNPSTSTTMSTSVCSPQTTLSSRTIPSTSSITGHLSTYPRNVQEKTTQLQCLSWLVQLKLHWHRKQYPHPHLVTVQESTYPRDVCQLV
ncbi:hypothetical protein OS493_029502 [Desmophyllum pertusum]|uniref:Uncharacterized protein n=1 Tax=Desmophyllum pertusum TaxID=174260 RepID=A0A9W9YC95_9CNID|nr:hypothetical protein OS493_029502 [Desmophyllum pertusum]